MKQLFSLLAIILSLHVYAQNKSFIRAYDSTFQVTPNSYLHDNREADFSEILDPHNIDIEKLNAAVFLELNAIRKSIRRPELLYDTSLDKMAYLYVLKLSYSKFKNQPKSYRRMNKYLYWSAKRMGIREGMVSVSVDLPYLIDYNDNLPYFYHNKDEETDLHLFYGDRSVLKEEKPRLKPIEVHTYQSFAEGIVQGLLSSKEGKKLRNKTYIKAACWLMPLEKNVNTRSIPKAKMMIVYSGKRLHFLEEL